MKLTHSFKSNNIPIFFDQSKFPIQFQVYCMICAHLLTEKKNTIVQVNNTFRLALTKKHFRFMVFISHLEKEISLCCQLLACFVNIAKQLQPPLPVTSFPKYQKSQSQITRFGTLISNSHKPLNIAKSLKFSSLFNRSKATTWQIWIHNKVNIITFLNSLRDRKFGIGNLTFHMNK